MIDHSLGKILDLLDIEPPADLDSESLVPLMDGGEGHDIEYVLSELYGNVYAGEKHTGDEFNRSIVQKAISDDTWKLIELSQESGRRVSGLYNLEMDPGEQENLYHVHNETRESMKDILRGI